MKNLGHRLGASGTYLENTIEGFHNSLDLVSDKNFKYWEFDIHESSDGILFVFHDDTITLNGEKISTARLSFREISEAGKSIGINIPKFQEVISLLRKRSERVMIEIKNVLSDHCREEILESVSGMDKWILMSTPERFLISFPDEDRDYWRERAEDSGVRIVRVGRHRIDLFSASKSSLGWLFAKPKWFFLI